MDELDPLRIAPKMRLILTIIAGALLLIFLRSFFLSVPAKETMAQAAKTIGRKTEWESPGRASIRDRFNKPLAINRPRYDVAILYTEIRKIRASLSVIRDGVRQKEFPRKEYICRLSNFLGETLGLNPERILDEIHAKASLYNTIPYVIQENISEEQYHDLIGKKNLWPGLLPLKTAERVYPEGPSGGDLIGYLGSMTREEYDRLIQEKEELRLFIEGVALGGDLPFPEGFSSLKEVKQRLSELENMGFRLSDSIGKMGLEKRFEKEIRGYRGKKSFLTDIHGTPLEELPGSKKAWPGKRLLLSLSSELQKEAEELLLIREEMKETRVKIGQTTKLSEKEPWIKGGAIVVMDPNSGEILALASYPRIDPSRFISKNPEMRQYIPQYFESAQLVADLWDGRRLFLRERFDFEKRAPYNEEIRLTWPLFLETILSNSGEAYLTIQGIRTVQEALEYFMRAQDRQDPLVVDLLSLLVNQSDPAPVKEERLIERHRRMQAHEKLIHDLRPATKELFTNTIFKEWRKENEKAFIKEMRALEKIEKKAPKPYLDYLDQKRDALFNLYWEQEKNNLILNEISFGKETPETILLKRFLSKKSPEAQTLYLKWLPSYRTQTKALRSKQIRKKGAVALQQDLINSVYPPYGFGFSRSWSFRQAAPQGSIFKLITAYAAMMHPKQGKAPKLNPLEMVDRFYLSGKEVFVGTTLAGEPIPQLYKGGRIPRSISTHLGRLDLLSAIEHSSNPYFSILAAEGIENPQKLLDAASLFSFGDKTGIDLPGEIRGFLPTDLEENKTGLYATAIGQHTLIVTPLQTSVMLSALANGGNLLKPQIVSIQAGTKPQVICEIPRTSTDPAKEALYSIGIDFPFVLSSLKEELAPSLTFRKREIVRKIPLPKSVQNELLEGMRRVRVRQTKENMAALKNLYQKTPWILEALTEVKPYMVGKSSTAEVLIRLNQDLPQEKSLFSHVWFGGILFEEKVMPYRFEKPELVIVVFLRFGGYGKEALPIAARLAQKWREIKARQKAKDGMLNSAL